MSSPAGVDNALKMREMFIQDYRYQCSVDIAESPWTPNPIVAVVTVQDKPKLYFAAFYFYADGTYFRGAN